MTHGMSLYLVLTYNSIHLFYLLPCKLQLNHWLWENHDNWTSQRKRMSEIRNSLLDPKYLKYNNIRQVSIIWESIYKVTLSKKDGYWLI